MEISTHHSSSCVLCLGLIWKKTLSAKSVWISSRLLLGYTKHISILDIRVKILFSKSSLNYRTPNLNKSQSSPDNMNVNFLMFEADLDFSRPWFSEIKVQIKKPNMKFDRRDNLKMKLNFCVRFKYWWLLATSYKRSMCFWRKFSEWEEEMQKKGKLL